MARAQVRVEIDRRNLEAFVGLGLKRDIERRTRKVRRRARELAPRGKTGRLKRAIDFDITGFRLNWTGRIFIDDRQAPYGHFVHNGTGVYGPHRRVIRPRTQPNLIFRSSTTGRWVKRPTVRGQRPKRFLVQALPAARD